MVKKSQLWLAVATLIGTIVGAGVLGIPYVVAQSGLIVGAVHIIVLGLALLVMNLYLGEIILRTKGTHQLTGYMELYLGKWGKRFMLFSMVVGIYGALIAYIIGEGQTIASVIGGNPVVYSLVFFVVVCAIMYAGLKATGKAELIIISLMLVVVALIGVFSADKINFANFNGIRSAFLFAPYGVVLFAFIGTAALPELKELLTREKKKFKKAIIYGSILPVLLYLFFTAIVIGIVGFDQFQALEPNQRIATIALSIYTNPILGGAANLFAILAMLTSFLGLGLALVWMYRFDYGIKKHWAFLLTVVPPLFIALAGVTTFITALGVTGALAGGVDGILIMIAYWKAKKLGNRKPEYSLKGSKLLTGVLIFMFGLGIVYQIWKSFL